MYKNDVPSADVLLKFGAAVEKPYRYERVGKITPLLHAIPKSSSDMVDLLLRHGANPNQRHSLDYVSPHGAAVCRDDVSFPRRVRLQLAAAADDSNPRDVPDYVTPLGAAVRIDDVSSARALLKFGAVVDDPYSLPFGKGRITPWQHATISSTPEMVQLLLQYRADASQPPWSTEPLSEIHLKLPFERLFGR